MDKNIERYYQVLDLKPTASREEIYQAYRDLVRVWDPERFATSPRLELMAETKLKEIVAAYHALEARVSSPNSAARQTEKPAPSPLPVADRYRSADILPRGMPAAIRPRPAVTAKPSMEPPRLALPPRATHPAALPPQPVQPPQLSPQPEPPAAVLTTPEPSTAVPPQPVQAPSPIPPPSHDPASARADDKFTTLLQFMRRSIVFQVSAATAGVLLVMGMVVLLYDGPSTPRARPANAVHGNAQPTEAPAKVSEADTTTDTPKADAGQEAAITPNPPTSASPQTSEPVAKRSRREIPNAEETPRQIANGTELLEPRGRRGAGVIRIANQSGQEAVAKLSSQSAPEIPLRLVYLQSGHDFTLNNIGPGLYFVSFSLGPVTSKPRMFGRRFGPFQFMQIESTSGAQSDQYQVVLKPVR